MFWGALNKPCPKENTGLLADGKDLTMSNSSIVKIPISTLLSNTPNEVIYSSVCLLSWQRPAWNNRYSKGKKIHKHLEFCSLYLPKSVFSPLLRTNKKGCPRKMTLPSFKNYWAYHASCCSHSVVYKLFLWEFSSLIKASLTIHFVLTVSKL